MLSHTEMWVNVSEPDAHDAHDGRVVVIDFYPADAADHAMMTRVVFAEAAVVPAAPGSAVWSFTYVLVGAVNAVPPSMSSHLFASVVAASPTVIGRSPLFRRVV